MLNCCVWSWWSSCLWCMRSCAPPCHRYSILSFSDFLQCDDDEAKKKQRKKIHSFEMQQSPFPFCPQFLRLEFVNVQLTVDRCQYIYDHQSIWITFLLDAIGTLCLALLFRSPFTIFIQSHQNSHKTKLSCNILIYNQKSISVNGKHWFVHILMTPIACCFFFIFCFFFHLQPRLSVLFIPE